MHVKNPRPILPYLCLLQVMVIGNPWSIYFFSIMLSDFPPPHTVRDSFPSYGVPSYKLSFFLINNN